MTKENAVQWLAEQGFNAAMEKSVVVVTFPVGTNIMRELTKVQKQLRDVGYNSSLGARQEGARDISG